MNHKLSPGDSFYVTHYDGASIDVIWLSGKMYTFEYLAYLIQRIVYVCITSDESVYVVLNSINNKTTTILKKSFDSHPMKVVVL